MCPLRALERRRIGVATVGHFYNSYVSMRRTKSETNIYESMGYQMCVKSVEVMLAEMSVIVYSRKCLLYLIDKHKLHKS